VTRVQVPGPPAAAELGTASAKAASAQQ